MTRKYIKEQEVKLYMKYRKEQLLNQESSCAKVGISIKSGYNIEKGKHYSFKPKKARAYKTRKSIIDNVWENELCKMLEKNPELQPKTLLIYLQNTHLNHNKEPIYGDCVLRTLQRRVARWQALNGKDKDIYFAQKHLPGVQSLSDFTHMDRSEIIINGKKFKHMLYHFRLVYSKWSYVKVIQTGESFQALSEGLQEALFALGGSTKEHRTDSLSAAFKNLGKKEKEDTTLSYMELCRHYNMKPTRNNKGESHENGSVESSHGHLKNRIAQELILRGSNEFDSISSYEEWVQEVVASSNRRNSVDFKHEQSQLQALPERKSTDYEVVVTKVSKFSIMVVKNMRYSMPSRLAGRIITVHIYQHKIDCYLGSVKIESLDRKYSSQVKSCYVINYRHIIQALVKKPRAFIFCKYRDEILPNTNYKLIWEYLYNLESGEKAAKIMLRLLKLAADYDCEYALEKRLLGIVLKQESINIESIECEFNITNSIMPEIYCKQHEIAAYDNYIPSIKGMEVYHASV